MTDITAAEYRTAEKVARSLGFVTAQSYADHAARLESEGAVPAGGMALTAEQVEDVRLLAQMCPWWSAEHVEQVQARVRSMFPATEPAEVISRYQTMQRGFAAKHFGFPANPVFEDRYTAPDGGKWQWTDELQWELRCYPPAPAVPAGEETKAEEFCCHPKCRFTDWGGINRKHERGADCPIVPKPASSPVVPAPTETGPWQRIEDVPEGVLQIKDRHGRTWLVVGGTWRFEWHDGNWYEPHTNINAQAPFVAAAEEG